MRGQAAIVAFVLYGCPSSQDADPDAKPLDAAPCFIGDPTKPPEVSLIYRTVDGRALPLLEDGQIPLIVPPQGGFVVFVGAKAKNIGCFLQITSALRDEATNEVVHLENRPLKLVQSEEGWGGPENPRYISNFSNLPACPAAGLVRDIQGQRYLLEVALDDRKGHQAKAQMHVVPVCAEDQCLTECLCQCDADYYKNGSSCEPTPASLDAGVCVPGDATQ